MQGRRGLSPEPRLHTGTRVSACVLCMYPWVCAHVHACFHDSVHWKELRNTPGAQARVLTLLRFEKNRARRTQATSEEPSQPRGDVTTKGMRHPRAPEQKRTRGKETETKHGLWLVTIYQYRSISHDKCAVRTTPVRGEGGCGCGARSVPPPQFLCTRETRLKVAGGVGNHGSDRRG